MPLAAGRLEPAAAEAWSAGMRGGATEGPVGDLAEAILPALAIFGRQSILFASRAVRGSSWPDPLHEFMAEDMADASGWPATS